MLVGAINKLVPTTSSATTFDIPVAVKRFAAKTFESLSLYVSRSVQHAGILQVKTGKINLLEGFTELISMF